MVGTQRKNRVETLVEQEDLLTVSGGSGRVKGDNRRHWMSLSETFDVLEDLVGMVHG